jgi:hypothetical protein
MAATGTVRSCEPWRARAPAAPPTPRRAGPAGDRGAGQPSTGSQRPERAAR